MPKTVSFSDPFVVTITIDSDPHGTPDHPVVTKDKDLKTCVQGPAVWFIVNNDTTAHTVSIDYTKIKHKSNGNAKEHPFPPGKNGNSVDVDAGSGTVPGKASLVDVIDNYKPNYNPDLYAYTVDVTTKHYSTVVSVDPDLEVVDPFPFQFKKKPARRSPKLQPKPKAKAATRSKSARRKR